MIACSACRASVSETATACPHCGTTLQAALLAYRASLVRQEHPQPPPVAPRKGSSPHNTEHRWLLLVVAAVIVYISYVVYSNSQQAPPTSEQSLGPMQSAPAPDQPIDPEWSRAFEQNRADRERARADQERATIEAAAVDAADLYAAYDANEVQADVTYRNRRIYVRGVVTEIGKDFLDAPFVTLRGLDDFSGVECTFSKSDEPELAGVRKGQTLTISGKCSGKIVMMVLVEGSKIAGRE